MLQLARRVTMNSGYEIPTAMREFKKYIINPYLLIDPPAKTVHNRIDK